MGVAKSDFSQMLRSRSDLIKKVEHFTRIDLDLKKNATNNDHENDLGYDYDISDDNDDNCYNY